MADGQIGFLVRKHTSVQHQIETIGLKGIPVSVAEYLKMELVHAQGSISLRIQVLCCDRTVFHGQHSGAGAIGPG